MQPKNMIFVSCLCALLLIMGGCNDRQGDTGTTNGHTTQKSVSGEKVRKGQVPTDMGTVPKDFGQ